MTKNQKPYSMEKNWYYVLRPNKEMLEFVKSGKQRSVLAGRILQAHESGGNGVQFPFGCMRYMREDAYLIAAAMGYVIEDRCDEEQVWNPSKKPRLEIILKNPRNPDAGCISLFGYCNASSPRSAFKKRATKQTVKIRKTESAFEPVKGD